MTQQDKELLLRDLCARLPYGVKLKGRCDVTTLLQIRVIEDRIVILTTTWCGEIKAFYKENLDECKPYLRPMSRMTAEEREEYQKFLFPCPDYDGRVVVGVYHKDLYKLYDWLNAHHFDYRGLIEKGLAIEVTEENNPYKQ